MNPMIKFLVASMAVMLFVGTHGWKMDRCTIARELRKHGFEPHLLNDWVCLVESESGGNTAARGPANSDGSHDFGLFQINDRYWCANGYRGKECGIDCNALLDDNISDDVKCARKIYGIHGFDAWYGWQRQCRGGRAPSVAHCF